MKLIAILLACFLLVWSSVKGQDLEKDFLKIGKAYTQLDTFKISFVVQVYKSEKDTVPSNTIKGLMCMQGENYYSNYEGMDILYNKDCMLIINNQSKNIIYTSAKKVPKVNVKNKMYDIKNVIDSLMATYDSVEYLGVNNAKKGYVIFTNKGIMPRVTITFDTISYLITQIEYIYNKSFSNVGNKVKVSYNTQRVPLGFDEKYFSDKKYINIKPGKGPVTIGKYSSYSLFNNDKAYEDE